MAKKQNNTLNELGVKKRINLSCLELNEGQIVGIPKNPRYLKGEEHDKLKKSLKDSPELLQYKPLMVYAIEDGKFVVICGNMRLRICQELHNEGVEAFEALPCFVLNKDVPIAKIKEYAIKDNVQAGNWDWDELANGDWEVEDLQDWGVDCSFLTESEDADNLEKKEKEEKDYSDEIVSEYKLEVDCKNEETLQALYEELTGRELECRILTL
ncbi:ParB N-terminal domain-containing protein [Prevotella sp.]|uniref:ParB N-terminal domain-containing protein n=1 Tax=Prevotella sp. TaxID=59823 RepID=UPI00307B763A